MPHPFKPLDPRPARHGWHPGKGDYCGVCHKCDAQFLGAKRCYTCADCAYAEPDPAPPVPLPVYEGLGRWLSAALEDPKVCEEMKADIRKWFERGEPDPLTMAVDLAVETLGDWLTDHTEQVFEEEPTIDGVRTALQEALETRLKK